MSATPSSNERKRPLRQLLRALGARLSLAVGSLLVTALILEGVTRLLVPPPTPVRLRDQIYVNQVPMVTGRDTVHIVHGAPLPEKKRPGEVRIFLFGESSVEGAPWAYMGSPPTMLYDQLKARFPQKDITVVNMGRSASAMRDAYYYLSTIGRFSPDYVVFYQGNNDMFSGDYEVCLPANHPHLHRAWRWLVEHSRLAWLIRAEGPAYYVHRMKKDWAAHAEASLDRTLRCDPGKGFQAWTDLLVETAKGMGAQVYVTTPVTNPLAWAEEGGAQWGTSRRLDLASRRGPYRRLLACLLTDDCDLVAAWRREQGQAPTIEAPAPRGFIERVLGVALQKHDAPKKETNPIDILSFLKSVEESSERITSRGDAWVRSAHRYGARVIDFFAYLKDHEDQGLRPPRIFVEDVHLSLRGYWTLAWLWAEALAPQFGGAATATPPALGPRYLPAAVRDLRQGPACILLHVADVYLRAGDPLLTANLIEQAAAYEHAAPDQLATSRAGLMSQLLKGWMRQQLGLDPQLPPALAAQLGHVDPERLHHELADGGEYCRAVGGDWLAPLVRDPDGAPLPGTDGAGPLAQASVEESDVSYVITPEGAQQIGAMLGMGEHAKPGGCSLDDVQIKQDYAHATYLCPSGAKAVIELRHASAQLSPVARTERFVLVAGTPPPSPSLVQDLVRSVRAGEASFKWQTTQPNAPPPKGDTSRRPAPRAALWLLLGLLVVAAGLVYFSRRRGRARGPTE